MLDKRNSILFFCNFQSFISCETKSVKVCLEKWSNESITYTVSLMSKTLARTGSGFFLCLCAFNRQNYELYIFIWISCNLAFNNIQLLIFTQQHITAHTLCFVHKHYLQMRASQLLHSMIEIHNTGFVYTMHFQHPLYWFSSLFALNLIWFHIVQ